MYGSGASIDNSLIYSNAWGNFRLDGGSTASLVNNTIVRSGGDGIYCPDGSPLIANNILAFNDANGLKVEGGTPVLRNNCVVSNALANYLGIAAGTNDLSVDPLLVDRAGGDYRLTSTSAAINHGDNAVLQAAWTDLDGRLRVAGAAVDLGAYEFGSTMAERLVDGMVRNSSDAGYVGENIFGEAGQTVTQTVMAGTAAIYYVKVKYTGNLPDHLFLAVGGVGNGWTLRAFDAANREVTAAMSQGGLIFTNVAPGAVTEARFEVVPDDTVGGNVVQEVAIVAYAMGNSLVRDTVKAATLNAPRYRRDLAISRASDVRYVGDNVINNTGEGQTKNLEVEAGEKAVYFVKVSNRGNLPDTILIRSSNGGAGWAIRFYDGLTSTNDITAGVTGAGWSTPDLALGASYEMRLEVVGGASLPAGSVANLLVTGTSPINAGNADVVRAVTTLLPAATTSQSGTYTLNADFEKGGLVGVEYQTVPDQLQLATEAVTLPFIWVPNSNPEQGTVSKIDTRTGRELGRYRACPPGVNGQPSRTTVDQQGNCWVANRQSGTVVKIGLYENGQYTDRNGDGIIQTSYDKNDNGLIDADELLDWGKDECVLYEVIVIPGKEGTFTPGTYTGGYVDNYWNPGPRGIAVDAKGSVWIGTHDSKQFYYLDGTTAQILRTIDVSKVDHTSYGAVIDRQGILWSAGNHRNHVLRLDPKDNSFAVIPIGHWVYGIWVDPNNNLYVTGVDDRKITCLDVLTGTKLWTVNGYGRGVTVTDDGDIWTPDSSAGTLTRWSNTGKLKATIKVGSDPTGVSVDADGKVWVTDNGDEYVHRINPANNTIELSKQLPGTRHYSYSDMTGIMARNATTRNGLWSVVHNGGILDTSWGTVSWHSQEPTGTSISVKVRSSNDRAQWSLWEKVVNGMPLHATPPGKYLEAQVTFQAMASESSPVLYDITLMPSGQAAQGQQVYFNGFQTGTDQVWSQTNVITAPHDQRQFLGLFGNTNLTLTLSNLPPHATVMVNYDLYVIGAWRGNNLNNNPDLWEANVAGGLKLLHASFNNGPTGSVASGQSYPEFYPGSMIHPARTGAAETNTLGFAVPGQGVMDSVYKLSHTFTHSADTLVLNFNASGLISDLAQVAWGLDNVQVRIIPLSSPPYLRALGAPIQGQFHLQVVADPGQTFDLQVTTNFSQWATILTTNTLATNIVDAVDDKVSGSDRRFYRAIQKP